MSHESDVDSKIVNIHIDNRIVTMDPQHDGPAMRMKERRLSALIREVRTCFNQLKTLAEGLHEDLDVTPSMRAVMESLVHPGPGTVPDIARSKGVSRQHVQTVMNALQEAGLVEPVDNPAHKRSPCFNLTDTGREVFATMEARERIPLSNMATAMPDEALQCASHALQTLNRLLAMEITKGESHEKPQ